MKVSKSFSMLEIIALQELGPMEMPPMNGGMGLGNYRAVKAVLEGRNTYADPDARNGDPANYLRWPKGHHGTAILRDGAKEAHDLQDHAAIAAYEERIKNWAPRCAVKS